MTFWINFTHSFPHNIPLWILHVHMYTTKQRKNSTPRNRIEKKESKTVVSTEVFSVCVINLIFFNVQIFYMSKFNVHWES